MCNLLEFSPGIPGLKWVDLNDSGLQRFCMKDLNPMGYLVVSALVQPGFQVMPVRHRDPGSNP